MIDTGIQTTHPDLKDSIWRNPGEIAGNGIDDDGNGAKQRGWAAGGAPRAGAGCGPPAGSSRSALTHA